MSLVAHLNRRRWVILALLFCSTVLNYLDRQALSILANEVQRDLGMTTLEYARVVQLFLGAYVVGYALSGWLTDRLGTRLSLALYVGWWSLANMATGFVHSVAQLGAARMALGLGEAGNYTAAPKAVSEQFAPKERGLAVGIYTAGAMIGATIAPPLIGVLALSYGWRAAFIATGAAGLAWLLAWLFLYRPAPMPSEATAATAAAAHIGLPQLLRDRSVWLLAGGRLVSDPVWYFYLFWFPKYLGDAQGLNLLQVAQWAWVPYLAADLGSVGGGWLSGRLVQRGAAPAMARVRVMGLAALLAPLGALIATGPELAPTLLLAAIVTFSHLMFLVNHTALITDRYPSHHVARVFGLMGMASALGGIASTQWVGQMASAHAFGMLFAAMACLHPLAWLLTRLATRQAR